MEAANFSDALAKLVIAHEDAREVLTKWADILMSQNPVTITYINSSGEKTTKTFDSILTTVSKYLGDVTSSVILKDNGNEVNVTLDSDGNVVFKDASGNLKTVQVSTLICDAIQNATIQNATFENTDIRNATFQNATGTNLTLFGTMLQNCVMNGGQSLSMSGYATSMTGDYLKAQSLAYTGLRVLPTEGNTFIGSTTSMNDNWTEKGYTDSGNNGALWNTKNNGYKDIPTTYKTPDFAAWYGWATTKFDAVPDSCWFQGLMTPWKFNACARVTYTSYEKRNDMFPENIKGMDGSGSESGTWKDSSYGFYLRAWAIWPWKFYSRYVPSSESDPTYYLTIVPPPADYYGRTIYLNTLGNEAKAATVFWISDDHTKCRISEVITIPRYTFARFRLEIIPEGGGTYYVFSRM